MTALDWYILFAIGFAIVALWLAYAANAATRRLREKAKEEVDAERPCECCCADAKGKGAEQ